MTAGQVVLLIVGIVAVVVLINVAIWIPIVRRIRTQPERMRQELTAAGEHLVLGPQGGIYRGATASGYPIVGGNGTIALTDRRLVFWRAFGRPIEVATSAIATVREARWFRGAARGGRMHLVVGLDTGGELAFYLGDNDRWLASLQGIGARLQPDVDKTS